MGIDQQEDGEFETQLTLCYWYSIKKKVKGIKESTRTNFIAIFQICSWSLSNGGFWLHFPKNIVA